MTRTQQISAAKCVAGLVMAVAMLPACGEEEAAAPTAAAEAKKEEAAANAALAESKTSDIAYSYDAVSKRDPFKTYFDELSENEPVESQNLTKLQKVDIDRLKLVAVIVGTATPMALVEDPSGEGHVLKIGTLVGKRLGQVKHIRRGEVVVQEEFRDFTGKRVPQLKELKLEEPR